MKVMVAGAGAMGSQIAMVTALAGHEVTLYDLDPTMLESSVAALRGRMDSQVAKGRRTADDVDAAFARLTTTTALTGDVDLVIEAIVEKLEIKRQFFTDVDALCGPGTILASNSSSFVPSAMASTTGRPDRFVILHFFNPALVMRCVEVVRGPETSDETAATAVAFVEQIGKLPVVLDKEIPGFVANRLLNAVRDEALALYEGGYAGIEAIDTAARTALGYPMGPFELMDLTGVDIGYHTKMGRFAETGDPADAPSATVSALVERGDLGRKTGRGIYLYDDTGARVGKAI
ncbi:3-hydroxyacyl-CoA dehydrogenase family protein [Gordonia sp. NB41Y]|uniref:3-hydroxyacyl-CoA dehydrogenase family protein n=1 Tax=Gordonia sp. NB41Y TaxID=875808 RepID=UPI0006B1B345|nr:3-hydroxyacyl-CoA dehydrogenase family protein [Gordonia sp. NB41Y]EMP11135.2 3-hydroxyacyl-CoA dehydrogenase [Gordonia sp. NB41Y]WLP93137.1 3-hydroxyacyl-CoA dehydrogenase family protein [Gordonia sp. NB41Y]